MGNAQCFAAIGAEVEVSHTQHRLHLLRLELLDFAFAMRANRRIGLFGNINDLYHDSFGFVQWSKHTSSRPIMMNIENPPFCRAHLSFSCCSSHPAGLLWACANPQERLSPLALGSDSGENAFNPIQFTYEARKHSLNSGL